MVADGSHSCVRIFSEDGVYLNRFELRRYFYHPCIAFHRWSENFVIAGQEEPLEYPLLHLTIFTKDGDFVRSAEIHDERIGDIRGITVTKDGQIAVIVNVIGSGWEVFII